MSQHHQRRRKTLPVMIPLMPQGVEHDFTRSVVIDLNMRGVLCTVCGAEATCRLAIPMYADMILPNTWDGEWAGFAACRACFVQQGTLDRPQTLQQFLQRKSLYVLE